MFLLATALLTALTQPALPAEIAGDVRLPEIGGRFVDPADPADGAIVVIVFARSDCPISNRYAPEIQRIQEAFGPHGVTFRLVYAGDDQTPEVVGRHLVDYGYDLEALVDADGGFARLVGATVTPEALVLDRLRQPVYRGRIDDRYVSFGVARPEPTRRDLRDAIAAALEGRPVDEPVTQAIGCYIPDLP